MVLMYDDWLQIHTPLQDRIKRGNQMLEILYRIYEVADPKTAKQNSENSLEFGLYSSISKSQNNELVMDCLICESRDDFKRIIKDEYGSGISFRYSRKLSPGDLYCVIIGEHCYSTEKYFNKVTFTCDCCGATIQTYYGSPICFSDYEIRNHFYGIEDYAEKRFCSRRCKQVYVFRESNKIRPNDDEEFYTTKDMFSEKVSGYIYKISKKSTGEFYIGQTMYAPVFRWGQHLKTERFPIENITDYQFEVIEIVPLGCSILEREKYWIQKFYKDNPKKSLNIMCTKGVT